MECLIAAALLLAGIACLGMGGMNADGTPRTLVWGAAASLFILCALWFGLAGLGVLK